MSLPELVVLSVRDSTLGSRYVSFTGPQRQLRCGPDEGVFSDLASFVVEPAENGLVHIRSRYENRYWVKASRFDSWLLSSAPNPVEDLFDDGCTLFRPAVTAGGVSVSFIHVQSGLNVTMRPPTDADAYNLCVELEAPTFFNFIDPSTSLLRLPKFVAMKIWNGMYFRRMHNVIMFDNFLQLAILPIHTTRDGRYIRFTTTWVSDLFARVTEPRYEISFLHPHQNPELPLDDPRLLYEVVRSSPPGTNEEGIALRSRAINCYCNREGQVLAARATSQHDRNAWLRPEDPTEGRLVTVTSFRHARVRSVANVVTSRIEYNPGDEDLQVRVPVTIQDIQTRRWSHSFIPLLNRTLCVFNAQVPIVNPTGELEFPDEARNVIGVWLELQNFTRQRNHTETFVVPPKTRVRLSLLQHVATCHVPFSYEQADVLKFQLQNFHQHNHDDGLFILEYAYKLEPKIEILTPEEYDAEVAREKSALNQGSEAQGVLKPETTNESSEALEDMMKIDADQLAEKIRQLIPAQDERNPDASNPQQGQGSEAEEDMIPDAPDQGSDAQEDVKP